jgi:hypothetical protein
MATLTPTPPAPAKPSLPRRRRAVPRDDLDLGGGQPSGPRDAGAPYVPPAKRRSVWPFLTDFGLVMALFGLIIAGRPLMALARRVRVRAHRLVPRGARRLQNWRTSAAVR